MEFGVRLPTSKVPRLHATWQRAATCFAQQSDAIKVHILRFATAARVRWQRLWNAAQTRFDPRARTRQRKRALLNTFEARFEDLCDLLCVSAREGIVPGRREQFQRLRAWMRSNYPSIRSGVRPYWQTTGNTAMDPFQTLVSWSSLDEIINASSTIEDISRARDAISGYYDSLRDE